MLYVKPIPAFSDNYIWLIINQDNNQAAVVDPGDATPVIDYCEQNDITLCAILITHHHHDHIGGTAKLAQHYNTPVWGPALETIAPDQHPLQEGDTITLEKLNNLTFHILDIPGHTSGHIAYVGNGWLFCGDTLFAGGCGRIFEGTPAQMYHSLEKLKSLDPQTLVFCAHEYTLANLKFALTVEPHNAALKERIIEVQKTRDNGQPTLPATLAKELKTNPFLRADCADIQNAAQHYCGHALSNPIEVFATIRQMKNNF